MKEKKNLKVIEGIQVKEIKGDGKKVTSLKLDNGREMKADGVFIEVGHIAMTELAGKLGVKLNDKDEIIIDRYSRTNVLGVLAAGDCCDTNWKQGIVSAGEGAHAANSAYNYLIEKKLVTSP